MPTREADRRQLARHDARDARADVRRDHAERVVISMAVTQRVHQPFGVLHGGASVSARRERGVDRREHELPRRVWSRSAQEINANHLRPKSTAR